MQAAGGVSSVGFDCVSDLLLLRFLLLLLLVLGGARPLAAHRCSKRAPLRQIRAAPISPTQLRAPSS
eukprot:COSAG01_NODE_12685_length_1700_cov_1.673329_2_plen_67_part_00